MSKYSYPKLYRKPKPLKHYVDMPDHFRTADISDIKRNGPATILFTDYGSKIVVKWRDDDGPYSRILGLNMVLVKYIVEKAVYHDCIEEIFRESHDPIETSRAIIVSHIGLSDYDKIYNKFISEKD